MEKYITTMLKNVSIREIPCLKLKKQKKKVAKRKMKRKMKQNHLNLLLKLIKL